MFKHTFKQIFRSLWRHKGFTGINLLGLSLGIAAVLLIVLIGHYERSFDTFHTKSQQLFRVVSETSRADQILYNANVPYPTGRFLRERDPGILASQIHFAEEMQVRLGEEAPFTEEQVVFADSLFFQVLDFAGIEDFWVAGNPATALQGPGKVVLTESTARQYFGSEDPIGKRLLLDNKAEAEVVGVVRDIPQNSHLPFNMLVSYGTFSNDFIGGLDVNSWGFTGNGYAYVRLQDERTRSATHEALQAIVLSNAKSEADLKMKMYLQPLPEIHFDLAFEGSNPTYTVSSNYLNMLVLLGIFIILIACINYINLSTSFAFTKSKEVGVRKTIGASKKQLFFHYMLETFTLTCAAAVLGLLLALAFLPTVNQILDKGITAAPLLELDFIAGSLLALLLLTFISGAYPALIMAGFNPVSSLKNQLALPGKSSVLLRKSLVVFQFSVSILLIICTLVIARQMEYFQDKELGFIKEAVVEVKLPEADSVKRAHFQSLLQNQTGIQQLSFCMGAPVSDNGLGVSMEAPELPENTSYEAEIIPCDINYKATFGLELLAGRWLLPSDEKNIGSAVVVNRQLINTLGYTDPKEAIGKRITLGINSMRPAIVGVTEDFHTSSLHEDITPVALLPFPYFYVTAGIRLHPGQMRNTLAEIEEAWRTVFPEHVYEISFVDETLASRYEQERRDYQLFKAFSVISIFICCIGLWGLIAFVVVRKTKEIGIRKVLGASISSIVMLISKDFLKLVGIALLIASPLAWYYMNQWLQDFAYRIEIGWAVFLIAGLFALLIAFLTISYQAIKAASANPVKSLRTD
ncbi:ABC transporter permease [Nafulsella turpanensis]|uniref:ABC transporter permease n=1 Tax=Nafulsella turpanensis TaxID=1265690 RepID=UPI00034C5E61|nr:ABC transporter permease [Nafulsella turpanensis]